MSHLEEVFKLNAVPTVTFVRPKEYSRLLVGLRTPGRGVIVEGPSGIGKTTAVTKVRQELGSDNLTFQELSARRPEDLEYISLIPEIRSAGLILVDDFHKLDRELQNRLADYLKLLADEGSVDTKLVLIGINEANRRLIEFAPDLQARLEVIRLENNPAEKLLELIAAGEKELNINIGAKDQIIEAAQGSFYLTQMLCHELCVLADVTVTHPEIFNVDVSAQLAITKLHNRLSSRFFESTRKFIRWVKFQNKGRAPYFEVLKALSESSDWTVDLRRHMQENKGLRGSVGQIVDKGFLNSFVLSEFASLMHYEEASAILSVEDPQYMFFLRETIWPELKQDAGFQDVEREHIYDFAFSFAGEQREMARMLAAELRTREHEVFYDQFEQSRIIAEDVEEYLRPIYQTQARYVVALLSEEYPEKVWTVFNLNSSKIDLLVVKLYLCLRITWCWIASVLQLRRGLCD